MSFPSSQECYWAYDNVSNGTQLIAHGMSIRAQDVQELLLKRYTVLGLGWHGLTP